MDVAWDIDFHTSSWPNSTLWQRQSKTNLLAHVAVLEVFGPQLGRPRVDTLMGSRYANMKEMRFDAADGVWRFAFAFDPKRKAILLCGGEKSGGSECRSLSAADAKADERFDAHLTATA